MSARREVTRSELDAPLCSYDDALESLAGAFSSLPARDVGLGDAYGCVLAHDVVAHEDIPAFDNSAMDGYAVRSADVGAAGVELSVADEVGERNAAKVMTGQPIPAGADAVVPWERTERTEDGRIVVDGAVTSGSFVRPRGEDLRDGELVIRAGTELGAVEVGVLASMGHGVVAVHPRPRVGVLSTGDELVSVDDAIGRGRVRDANGPLLVAACRGYGADISGVERTIDDPEHITAALRRLASVSDLIVTSGGASVGEKDWLRTVLEREGELDFWRVALRPGKPVALGSLDSASVIVLPGNPGSVLACGHVFVGRAVRHLAGRDPSPAVRRGVLANAIEGDPARTVVHPVRTAGDAVTPVVTRSSQVLSNALGVHGWVIVPVGGLPEGAEVEVELQP